jgi:penicillin-binding protein 2
VALDPRSGDVLELVSKPTFDPNMFVDGIDVENWQQLNLSPDKPLLNRALRGTYPPGSTYKPFMALAALETNKRSPEYTISDPGYFMFGNHRFRDDKEGGHGRVNMYLSIVASCDTYYYTLANEMGVDTIYEQMHRFGFGEFTGIDILGESRGLLPSTDWKRRAYRKPEQQKWYAGETISLGIGQGYNAFTMLQLAQATATLANNGVRYPPRLVSATVDAVSGAKITSAAAEPVNLGFSQAHIDVIREAMVGVTIAGTSARAFAGTAYVSAGKTGTAQAVGIGQNEKYDASKIAEHLRDHALYITYAPADKPTIALAMVVENAGFGAEHAAPIARRALDYWLLGKYPNAQDMEAVSKGQASAPIGVPRNAAEMVWPQVRPVASPPAPGKSPAWAGLFILFSLLRSLRAPQRHQIGRAHV